jgi:hypothetical protein
LLGNLAQGLQLVEVLLCHPVPPVRLGNGAVTDEHGERHVDIVPQVEPLLSPPFHRFGYGDVKIRIDTLPKLMWITTPLKIVSFASGLDCAALGDSVAGTSRGIGVMTHQIPAHRMPQRTPHIPPLTWGTRGSRACSRSRAPPPS